MRRFLAPLALSAASVLGFLALAEMAARLGGVSVGTVQINRGVVRTSPNPKLGFELRPNSFVASEVDYRINGEGFRGAPLSAKRPDRRRVAVFGDSIVFGYWVSEKDAFPSQLGVLLGPEVEALNLGVPGYNLDQEVEYLRQRVDELDPDLVVFGFCLNDLEGLLSFEYGLTQARREARSGPRRLLESLLSFSRFAAWIEYRLTERDARAQFARARNPLGGQLYEASPRDIDAHLDAGFRALSATLSPRGIEAAVAIFPVLGNQFANYPYKDLHARIRAAAGRSGLIAIDMLPCFEPYAFREVRVDVVHPNPMGHRIAAHAAAVGLWERLFKDRPKPVALQDPCTGYRLADFPMVKGY